MAGSPADRFSCGAWCCSDRWVGAVAGHLVRSGPVPTSAIPADRKPSLRTSSRDPLGERESVNRGFRPWMQIMGYSKARVGQPFHLSGRKLRKITTPTLVFLDGKDGLVGGVSLAYPRETGSPPRAASPFVSGQCPQGVGATFASTSI